MTPKKILIVAGEPSGDLHASDLVNNLKNLRGGLEFFGIGGSLMKKAGVDIVFDITPLALVGLVEVLKNIFTVGTAFRDILRRTDLEKPDLAILVDYPGFNLRLAKELRKRSIPVVYYISPQVWAWGRDRVGIIQKCVKKIIVFFKFEEELYKTCGIDAEFAGHPLLDTVKASSTKDEFLKKYSLDAKKRTIALLPGSRSIEVRSLLATMASSAALIEARLRDVQFAVAKHPSLGLNLYEDAIKGSTNIKIVEGETYNLLNASDFAIVASGTATLETAIIGTPLVIVYKANLVTYILYRVVATMRFLGLVNIIAGKEVAPELLQYKMTPQNIANTVLGFMNEKPRLAAMREELGRVKASLGAPGASLRAARFILPLLH